MIGMMNHFEDEFLAMFIMSKIRIKIHKNEFQFSGGK